MVSERHLAGPRARSAAHDGRRGSTVVRRPERRRCERDRFRATGAGDGVDARHLERRLGDRAGARSRESAREHRLADSRRPREQEVVAAGGGDLECPTCTLLPANVGEIRRGSARVGVDWRRACGRISLASEVLGRLGQVPDRHGIDACEGDLRLRTRRGKRARASPDVGRPRPPQALRERAEADRQAPAHRLPRDPQDSRAEAAGRQREPRGRSASRIPIPPFSDPPVRD